MPHSLMTDFESSMLSALNQFYPGIPQIGCLLDQCQRGPIKSVLLVIIGW